MAGPNHDRNITTIVVEQIPEECFEEKRVREFFSQFGIIEEVTMQAYKRLALVKYNDYYAAKAAYDSPKVIFDNRFVKVYWYNPDSTPSVKANGTVASPPSVKVEEPAFDKEKFERDSQAAQKKLEERKALLQATEEKRKEIEKAKEDLDRKRAEEKKKLEEKLKAKGMSLSDVGLEDTPKPTNGTNGKTSAQTKALRAQVAALEKEAMEMGIDPNNLDELPSTRGRGRGRGRGSYRGWEGFAGRGTTYDSSRGYGSRGGFGRGRGGGAYNLDNRTKKVKVEGVVFDEEKDEGLKHFLIVSYYPACILSHKSFS
jgi:RNA-binding protein 26